MGAMWEHWYSEEGEAAKVAMSRAAERDEAALLELMERYPERAAWLERQLSTMDERLAELGYLDGGGGGGGGSGSE